MNFLALKQRVIKETGRYDFEDRPADLQSLVNEGLKYLYDLGEINKNQVLQFILEPGTFSIAIPTVRSINKVMLGGRLLKEGDLVENLNPGSGSPMYYQHVLSVNLTDPDTGHTEVDPQRQYIPTRSEADVLLFSPVANIKEQGIITGVFYPEMNVDFDTCWLMKNRPNLCVAATCMFIEIYYRNVEGQRLWLNTIQTLLSSLENAKIEQAIDTVGLEQ